MASHYSGANGSLVHATASRPIIPTNRRRQPTIERGFSGVKVPIISLEQDLDKSHLNDLVSIVAKDSTKLQTKPDSNRPESLKRRSLQKPGVSTKPELVITTANGGDNKQSNSNLAGSNNQPQANNSRRRGFPLFSPVSRQTGKAGGSKPKGFFNQGEPSANNTVSRKKDGSRLFRLRFGKNKLTSARPKSSNQLDLEIGANTVLKDVDSSAVALHGDEERNEVASAQTVVASSTVADRETKEPEDVEKQIARGKMPDAVQQPLTSENSESHSTSKHVDSERMTKSKSAKELGERARVAAAELRKSVNAANAATFSSFSRKTDVQGGDVQHDPKDNSTEETHDGNDNDNSELVQEAKADMVPPVSPLAPSTEEKPAEVKVESQANQAQPEQEKQEAVEQQNKDDSKKAEEFQLLSSSWTPIKRNSVLGPNDQDIPISAHRMSVLEKQAATVAPSVPPIESGRRLSNFAGMLTEVPTRASPNDQLTNPGLEVSMIEPSFKNEETEESPNKSRLAAFLIQANASPAPTESTSPTESVSTSKDETKTKQVETPTSTASPGLVKSVVSRLSIKATLPPSVLRMQTSPSKTSSSVNRGSVTGDAFAGKSVATSPVTVSAPPPPRTAEEIKAMVERNVARMTAFLESVRLAQEAAAKAAEAARNPPPEPEKPKKAFLKAYLAVTASHNAKLRGEPEPATLEPQQPLSRLAAFLAEIAPPPPPAAKAKRGKPFFRPAAASTQAPSTAQPKAPQQPSRLSMFLSSSSSSSSKNATPVESPSKTQATKDVFPSDVETHGDRLRTQYIHMGNQTAKSTNEDVAEKKEVVPATSQKDASADSSASGTTRRNSKLVAPSSSVFRRPSLPRAVSSPSIRDAQPISNSPKTRSRKNSSASPSPKPATTDRKSPVIAKMIDLEDKRVAELSEGRAEVVKSVSLKDFSLKETLEKYKRSASGKGKKLLVGEDGSDHEADESQERRRPSLVNSVSLNKVSLAETLAMYQANSSRSLTNNKS